MSKTVRFIGHDEDQRNCGGCAETVGVLEPDCVYEVEHEEVHSWHTRLYLKGIKSKGFNSVMFETVKAKERHDHA